MIEQSHYPAVLALNNAAVPHVNELSAADFAVLHSQCDFSYCIAKQDTIKGFVIGFCDHNKSYAGFHLQWFQARYENFLYIDRIVVNPDYRGLGIGDQLYAEAIKWCTEKNIKQLTCEVNDQPPNPGSHRFHQKIGFDKIESIGNPAGKTVCMYLKVL